MAAGGEPPGLRIQGRQFLAYPDQLSDALVDGGDLITQDLADVTAGWLAMASSVCVGKIFKVGVWYQQFSGDSRRYRVAVYNPGWRRVLYKRGRAPSSHWRFWRVRTTRTGKYHTVYRTRYQGK